MRDSVLAKEVSQQETAAIDSFYIRVEAACEEACEAIAPAWPLDQSIAVNPHWKRIHLTVRQVAARMLVLSDIQVFPSRSHILKQWQSGRISPQDLGQALASFPAANVNNLTTEKCIDSLTRPVEITQLPLLIDVLDDDPQRGARLSWREAITHQVSQTCAAYFDTEQADWQPSRSKGLYAFWRDTLLHDHGIGILMGLPKLGKSLNKIPTSRKEAELWVMRRLGLPEAVWADYLEAILLTVNGWASWCAYLGWQAKLSHQNDEHLRDLLAIRLAWGAILLDMKQDNVVNFAFKAIQKQWQHAHELILKAEKILLVDEIWQSALEIGYQRQLETMLTRVQPSSYRDPIEVQAAFCIDVRSERFRRALETISPSVQTLGVAGFFGMPVDYTPMATHATRPQLPGLLAPALGVSDQMIRFKPGHPRGLDITPKASVVRRRRFARTDQVDAASRWPNAAFSYVEVAGWSYLGKLMRWVRPARHQRSNDDQAGIPQQWRAFSRYQLISADLDTQITLAEKILLAMGINERFAPLVMLVGHGSQSANNAHAAALDCGACCGQTGEVNARVLAGLLNDVSVRIGLQARGVHIPEDTVFVAALHNTTTDEIEVYDLDMWPQQASKRWESVKEIFEQAGALVRKERAASLGLHLPKQHLHQAIRLRANDGAQTRPEWGLVANAAFIMAPRERTRAIPLHGRTFLHEYDYVQDKDGSLLEQLMTAPMLVTHWINWQYHASTCEPDRLGSGNKVLHNVVGGRIGVFEGNGGDLRIGLSKQSVHDGQNWMHEPLRLTVIIDAPAHAIERVIMQHDIVKQLIDNQWLHLWRYEQQDLLRYAGGRWIPVALCAA